MFKILIVEDSLVQAEMLKSSLVPAGYEVIVSTNGKEALSLIPVIKPSIVISDILMPIMDGYELCRLIKMDDNIAHIPVILLTELNQPSDVIKALESKADGFISKPYNNEHLITKIKNLKEKSQLIGSNPIKLYPVQHTVTFDNQTHMLASTYQQLFDLLLNTYENVIIQNKEQTKQAKQHSDLEGRYKALYENLPDAIFLSDHETGIIVDANIAAERLLKKTRKKIIGIHQSQLHPPIMEDAAKEKFKNFKETLIQGLSTNPTEMDVICSDGSIVPVEIMAHIVNLNGRQILQGVFRDIRERKESERLKIESEEFYKSIFENNNSMMFLINPDNLAIVDANIKACEFYGYTKEEFISMTLLDINLREEAEIYVDINKVKAYNSNNIIVKHRLSNGEIRDVEIYVSTVIRDGKFLFYSIVHDITERIKMEAELKEGQNLLQSIMDNSPSAIFIKNLQGQYIKIGSKFKELFGVKTEDALYKTPLDIMLKEDAVYVMESDKIIIEKGHSIKFEHTFKLDDGVHTFLTVKFPLYNLQDEIYAICVISTDITGIKKNEQRLLRELLINQTMSRLTQTMLEKRLDIRNISKLILDGAMELTESVHGFAGEVKTDTGEVIGHTLTDMMDKECKTAKEKQNISFPKGADGYNGLWGHALNTLKSFYTNTPSAHESYKGLIPDGHITLKNYLSVPILFDRSLIGQIAVANSIRDYTDEDILIVEKLAVLFAIAINRTRIDTNLEKNEFLFKTQFDLGNIGISITSIDKGFITVNQKMYDIFGYSQEEFSKITWAELVHRQDMEPGLTYFNQMLKGERDNYEIDLRCIHKDGSIIYTHLNVSCYRKPDDGQADFFISYINDITKRIDMENKIQASLKEKELLLREIHHRVKNNMAIVVGILSMQRNFITDVKQLELFRDSENRIKSMALIHERLYRSKDLATVDFMEYINSLTVELFDTYKINHRNIKLKLDINNVYLGIDIAIPCGLLLNELISNALKHAFPNQREGVINISMKRLPDGRIELIVKDNGIGIPEDIDIRNTESIGWQLIIGLSETQLEGEIELNRDNGTEFKARVRDNISKLDM
jgi:PAS domain S-box-containing protein